MYAVRLTAISARDLTLTLRGADPSSTSDRREAARLILAGWFAENCILCLGEDIPDPILRLLDGGSSGTGLSWFAFTSTFGSKPRSWPGVSRARFALKSHPGVTLSSEQEREQVEGKTEVEPERDFEYECECKLRVRVWLEP